MQQTTISTTDTILRPYRLSDELNLANSIVMAPMTRSMADDRLVPTADMAAYYTRRANAGLIVTEGTIIAPEGQGYPNTPGIYSEAQIDGWRAVTDGVHDAGGRIFLQLWHVGRVSHPDFLGGRLPVAPSPVPLSGDVPRMKGLRYGTPRGLGHDEIAPIVRGFATGASNARAAGFDGVEIHGANGYLIDQFLHHHTNRRQDEYGRRPENMARFALEIVDAVSDAIGQGRVGIRLSPGAHFNMEADPRDALVFACLLEQLGRRRLAYVHNGIFDDKMTFDYLEGSTGAYLRRHYKGTLIGNGSYSIEAAAASIESGLFDLIAFGRPFIANPDLVSKIRSGEPMNVYDPSMLAQLN